jgi:hypothetical protein
MNMMREIKDLENIYFAWKCKKIGQSRIRGCLCDLTPVIHFRCKYSCSQNGTENLRLTLHVNNSFMDQ